MASGPSDGNNDPNWLERRRWGDSSKVYTRKYKGRRNKSATATATATVEAAASAAEPTTAEPASVPSSENADKVNESDNFTNTNILEPPAQTLAVEDGKYLQQEQQPGAVQPEAVEAVQPEVVEVVPLEAVEVVKAVPPEVVESVPPEVVESVPPEVVESLPPEVVESVPQDEELVGASRLEECNRLEQDEGASSPVAANLERTVEVPESHEDVMQLEDGGGGISRLSSNEMLAECREVGEPPQPSGIGEAEAEGNGVVRQQLLLEPRPELQQPVITRVEDRVRINVTRARSRDEIREVRRKLETELDQIRGLFKNLEAKEVQLTAYSSHINNNINSVSGMVNTNNSVYSFGTTDGNFGAYSQPQYVRNDVVERRTLNRVNTDMGAVRHQVTRPFNRSLSVSVVENNHGVGEFVEREKRTPKANQYYRNSEFLLGKDRLPPESNKKSKPNVAGRKHGEMNRGFGFGFDKNRERMFRSCSSLLQRLMKHNYGWVFNEPVDAKKLGLHDYHDIIKHPMDFGTIKTRLSQNYYKSPREFAEDVRLVFHNAMTYNPKGQDVHVMAEVLLKIFEERWAVIETEYNPDWRYQMYHDAGLPTPTSKRAPATQFYTPARAPSHVLAPASVPIPPTALASTPITPASQIWSLDRSESMTTPIDARSKPSNIAHVGRTPAPKKPKARDPNKRDMTYDEKQKLSSNLQDLPAEKLDAIVQIIKKRNSSLNQHDDEIEVDIDSVDAETLWELDRFVTNYKKSLSKNKRKAELALQARAVSAQTIAVTNSVPAAMDVQKDIRTDENNAPPAQIEDGDNASRSSSSSSSSSDSGSSSSDSESDSSSTNGSDAGQSPGT